MHINLPSTPIKHINLMHQLGMLAICPLRLLWTNWIILPDLLEVEVDGRELQNAPRVQLVGLKTLDGCPLDF